ncbi:hypothetical protein KY289_037157 [Solanum tuberosum]|nr:hypothetical protein KY284_036996 [Solanum tuberosum]KAH0637242.1 hypothetical protein KY289_037157 [Solanum tuberosum]
MNWKAVTRGPRQKERWFWYYNVNMLMKWRLKFKKEVDAVFRRVLVEKFTLEVPWITKISTVPHGTGLWKHILGYWNKFKSNMGFILSNGRKIRFWEDTWLGHTSLKDHFMDIFKLFSQQREKLQYSGQQKDDIFFLKGILMTGKWKDYTYCSRGKAR